MAAAVTLSAADQLAILEVTAGDMTRIEAGCA